jgi:uncharacterized protein (TIGR03083 family)
VNTEAAHPTPARDRDWYLAHVTDDVARFAAAVRSGDLGADVADCPGWDLRALTAHMGMVHRWAERCAATAEPQRDFEVFAPAPGLGSEALADWLVEGAERLVATLRQIDLDAATWHPFPVARIGRVWPRRQAHEISIHRRDAELAAGLQPAAIDPDLASDGIDEYFELVIPRLVKREGTVIPSASLHVHCTDTHGEWLVHADADGYHLERAHAKGAAALRGPAEAILLRLWNRSSDREGELSPVGDEAVLDAWLTLSGL